MTEFINWEFLFKPASFMTIIALAILYFLYMNYAENIRLCFSVILNFIKILFKRDKNIKINLLDFNTQPVFTNSYFTIKYNFTNAIWFRFKGIATKSYNGEIVLNLKKLKQKEIVFIVQGFFRKKEYKIELIQNNELKSDLFRLRLNKISDISEKLEFPSAKAFRINLRLIPRSIYIKKLTPIVKQQSINIKLNSFNQNEFL